MRRFVGLIASIPVGLSIAMSICTPAFAQSAAGAAGASPGTAPNAPPPPGGNESSAPGATRVKPSQPAESGAIDASASMPSGPLSADTVGQRAAATSYQAVAATQTLSGASARVEAQWQNYLPRLSFLGRYTRLSSFTPPDLSGGFNSVGTQAPPGTVNPPIVASPGLSFPLVLDNGILEANLAVPISDYFLRIGQSYTSATLSEDAARYDIVAARATSYANGKVAYYSWLRSQGAVTVANQSLAVAQAHLNDSSNQFQVGNASKADVLRAQTQVSAAELAVEKAKSGVVLAERQVRLALHVPDSFSLNAGDSLDGEMPPAPTDVRALMSEGLAKRAEIKSIDKNAESAKKLAAVQKAGRYPVVSAFGEAQYSNPNQRRFPSQQVWFGTWQVGAQVTWSPNDVFTANANGADAESRAAGLEAQKSVTRDGIELEVTQAYQAIFEADAGIVSTQRQLESAQEGYRVARELFNNGRGTATTLIDAEIVLAQTRFDRLNAQADGRIARVRLEHATGRDQK